MGYLLLRNFGILGTKIISCDAEKIQLSGFHLASVNLSTKRIGDKLSSRFSVV